MQANAKFIGFTSGCGGSGTTSAAVALGRSLSRLENKKVLYISFDFLCSKCLGDGGVKKKDLYDVIVLGCDSNILEKSIISDEYGLKYMSFDELINPLQLDLNQLDFLFTTLSLSYDVVILDAPSNSIMSAEVLPYCDDIVVVYGYNSFGYQYCDDQFSYTKQLCLDSNHYKLYTDFDKDSFLDGKVDIHGSFGAKVRELANQIEF